MKLQLTSYKTIYTIETEHDNLHISEYFDFIKGLLIQAGFAEISINETIIKLAEELKEDKVWDEIDKD
jgi:hypothetical protein